MLLKEGTNGPYHTHSIRCHFFGIIYYTLQSYNLQGYNLHYNLQEKSMQEVMDHLIYNGVNVSLDGRRQHHELQQDSSATRLISNEKKSTSPLHQKHLHHPNIIQIAEKRLERLLICTEKSKQSREALEIFESENRNYICCTIINNGLKKRIVLNDTPSGGPQKRHKKESSSWTLTCPHSSRDEKKLLTTPVSLQTTRRHRTLDRVVQQNKFDELEMDFMDSFFEIESQDTSIFGLELDGTACSSFE